ncbi:Guanine exchange factor for Rac 30, partial [Durusdinium trenchii]
GCASTGAKVALALAEIVSTELKLAAELDKFFNVFGMKVRAIATAQYGVASARKLKVDPRLAEEFFGTLVRDVLRVSTKLAASLQQAQQENFNSIQGVCGALLESAPEFEVYGAYCRSFSRVNKELKELCKCKSKGSLQSLWVPFSERHMGGESLCSALIKPVQRVPRYVILLQSLRQTLEAEDPHHPDLAMVNETLSAIVRQASALNESIQTQERLRKILGDDVPDQRQFARTA